MPWYQLQESECPVRGLKPPQTPREFQMMLANTMARAGEALPEDEQGPEALQASRLLVEKGALGMVAGSLQELEGMVEEDGLMTDWVQTMGDYPGVRVPDPDPPLTPVDLAQLL